MSRTKAKNELSLEQYRQEIFGFGTPQAIYKWQHGTAMPTIDNLVVSAAVLQVKVDDILVVDAVAQAQVSA